MNKKAGVVADFIGSNVSSLIPVVGQVAAPIGVAAGTVGDKSTEGEIRMNESPESSFLPGVGASRIIRRLRRQNTIKDRGTSPRALSSSVGPFTSTMLLAAAGGLLGLIAPADSNRDRTDHALRGLVGGAAVGGVGNFLGHIAAGVTDTRTPEEQQEAAASMEGRIADYLVPGVGNYNFWKSLGRSLADEEQGITAPRRY